MFEFQTFHRHPPSLSHFLLALSVSYITQNFPHTPEGNREKSFAVISTIHTSHHPRRINFLIKYQIQKTSCLTIKLSSLIKNFLTPMCASERGCVCVYYEAEKVKCIVTNCVYLENDFLSSLFAAIASLSAPH